MNNEIKIHAPEIGCCEKTVNGHKFNTAGFWQVVSCGEVIKRKHFRMRPTFDQQLKIVKDLMKSVPGATYRGEGIETIRATLCARDQSRFLDAIGG